MDEVTARIFADIEEVAAELGLTMTPVSTEEWVEMGRRACLRRGMRFHITRSAPGSPLTSSWWSDEAAARERFDARVREFGGQPGACITLIDEAERKTLAVWPEETGEELDGWPRVVGGPS